MTIQALGKLIRNPAQHSYTKILTFNVLDLHFPGYTLSLEVMEVSLKLDPLLKLNR